MTYLGHATKKTFTSCACTTYHLVRESDVQSARERHYNLAMLYIDIQREKHNTQARKANFNTAKITSATGRGRGLNTYLLSTI